MKPAYAAIAILGGFAAILPLASFAPPSASSTGAQDTGASGQPRDFESGPFEGNRDFQAATGEHILAMSLVSSAPFHYSGDASQTGRATECLAAAAWYEAGDDPVGQSAVIQTVINRVKHPAFPDSVCGVVFEGSHRSTGCQFTFTCDGSLQRRRPSTAARARALKLAREALNGNVDQSIGEATHYHANYVVPWWSSKLERLTAVGPHIFYKWRGAGGLRNRVSLGAEADYADLVRGSNSHGTVPGNASVAIPPAELSVAAGVSSAPAIAARPPQSPNLFFVAVETSQPSGRWALSAMQTCKGRGACQVVAYGSDAAAANNRAAAANQRARPLFMFVRDPASGMELALWDCQSVQRDRASQCLPDSAAAVSRLMRDRTTAE